MNTDTNKALRGRKPKLNTLLNPFLGKHGSRITRADLDIAITNLTNLRDSKPVEVAPVAPVVAPAAPVAVAAPVAAVETQVEAPVAVAA